MRRRSRGQNFAGQDRESCRKQQQGDKEMIPRTINEKRSSSVTPFQFGFGCADASASSARSVRARMGMIVCFRSHPCRSRLPGTGQVVHTRDLLNKQNDAGERHVACRQVDNFVSEASVYCTGCLSSEGIYHEYATVCVV